jgi:hypothetical protein
VAKIGRPSTGQRPAIAVRLPPGWLKQIARIGRETGESNSKIVRALIGSALAARKAVGSNGIERIDTETARSFVELWHYSGNVPSGKNVCFGWFVESELYAVAIYGIGVNQAQHTFLAHLTGLPVTRKNLFELRRLCRVEPARDGLQLTQFIAACHRILKREHGIRYVVSFSDPAHNGFKGKRSKAYASGGVYAAANFKHIGRTNGETHTIGRDGRMEHRRKAYRYKQRMGGTTAQAREKLGLRTQRTRGKDRWLIDLGSE